MAQLSNVPADATVGVTIYALNADGTRGDLLTERVECEVILRDPDDANGRCEAADDPTLSQLIEWDVTENGITRYYSEALYAGRGVVPATADDLPAAPDNTGIAAAKDAAEAVEALATSARLSQLDDDAMPADLTLTRKMVSNKTVESADGTRVSLYDDDNTTILGYWPLDKANKTTGKFVPA